jgi:hypothetical protein
VGQTLYERVFGKKLVRGSLALSRWYCTFRCLRPCSLVRYNGKRPCSHAEATGVADIAEGFSYTGGNYGELQHVTQGP